VEKCCGLKENKAKENLRIQIQDMYNIFNGLLSQYKTQSNPTG
jgi:hypothetical protein